MSVSWIGNAHVSAKLSIGDIMATENRKCVYERCILQHDTIELKLTEIVSNTCWVC